MLLNFVKMQHSMPQIFGCFKKPENAYLKFEKAFNAPVGSPELGQAERDGPEIPL